MDESKTEKVCEEWFEYLGKQLRSADDFEVKKRTENPEKVPEKFKNGYDIKVIEPHPVWREVYCEAAGKTLERVEKIKGKFDSGSRKRTLLNAWWWYRVAHLSLGIDFDWNAVRTAGGWKSPSTIREAWVTDGKMTDRIISGFSRKLFQENLLSLSHLSSLLP